MKRRVSIPLQASKHPDLLPITHTQQVPSTNRMYTQNILEISCATLFVINNYLYDDMIIYGHKKNVSINAKNE